MNTYGLMPEQDYRTLDDIFYRLCETFPTGIINTLEIGVHNGNGSRGIHKFFTDAGRINFHTGIDNQRDFEMDAPFPGCNFIIGNSIEVYNQIPDRSQHFLLIDGCHNYPMTMADFLVYSSKIKQGGFVAFHDTGAHIPAFKDYQGMGSREDQDMYISCRRALLTLGLLEGTRAGWILCHDEADTNFDTGGITSFIKNY